MRFAMASAATSVDHDINRSKALKFSASVIDVAGC
jgi:hypothetical protein